MQTENTDNLIQYDTSYQRKQIIIHTISVGDIEIEVPVNTKWVIIERQGVFISSDTKEPRFEPGFKDGHNGDWVNYSSYNCYNKKYIGQLARPNTTTELIKC